MAMATPNEVLEKLKDENRPAYAFLLTGIGFFASAAVVFALINSGATLELLIGIGGVVLLASIAIYACVEMVHNVAIRAVLSWALCLAIMVTMMAAGVSVVRPDVVPPISCWTIGRAPECPGDVAAVNAVDALEAASSKTIGVPDPPCPCELFASNVNPPWLRPGPDWPGIDGNISLPDSERFQSGPADRTKFTVHVWFAGIIVRERAIEQANAFRTLKWQLDDVTAARGGVRTGDAAGLNVVRYAAGDESAAETLASDAMAEGLNGGRKISTQVDPSLTAGRLELWISR